MLYEGQGSVVVTMTCYGLDGPGFKCWWEREIFFFSMPFQTSPGGQTILLYSGCLGSFQGASGQGMALSGVRMSRTVTVIPLCASGILWGDLYRS